MRLRLLTSTALLLCATLAAPGADAAQPKAQSTLTSIGIVDDGQINSREIWFTLSQIDQRFVLERHAMPDADAFFEALKDSAATGRSVYVAFDPETGEFEDGGDKPSYLVRRIEYDGKPVAGMKGMRSKNSSVDPAESALARGVAYYAGGMRERALPELDRALSGGKLRRALQALALETRGSAITDSIWSVRQELTEEDDRQFVRALEDFRAWTALQPDSLQAHTAVAYMLRDLGAYEEAIEIFRSMNDRWPDQKIRHATRIGATYRIMGDYERALAALDELVASDGPQEGMMFHYHRGWTLNLLGRYEEAVTEFTEGLKTQPDYFGAFHRRACAYAQLGRLPEALADRQRANAELKTDSDDRVRTPATEHDLRWGEAVAAEIEAAIRKKSSAPMSAPCEGDWNYGETRRERSRLLTDGTPES